MLLLILGLLLVIDLIRSSKNEAMTQRYHNVLTQKKFEWQALTEHEAVKWYAPVDLCILQSQDRVKFAQTVRVEDCYPYSKGSRRQFCGVGMGNNNYPCYGPFNTSRPYFLRGIAGYKDPTDTPLLNFFSYLHLTNTTFLFLGDSTMRQKLQALQCELSRETNGQAKFYGNIFGILPCDTFLTIYFPSTHNRRFRFPSFSYQNVSYPVHPLADQAVTLYAISLGPKSVECYQKILKDREKTHMNATREYQLFSLQEEPWTILSDQRTNLEGLFGNAARYVNELNFEQSRNVFIAANMGLWFNLPTEYAESLPPVLEWLSSVHQRKQYRNTIAWHETLRQHWPNQYDHSGNYVKLEIDQAIDRMKGVNYSSFPLESFVGGLCCTAIQNDSLEADWRNQMIRKLLSEGHHQSSIVLFPLAEISK